jgi:rubrerythrin
MYNQVNKPAVTKWPKESLNILDTCQHIHKHAEEFYQYLAEIHHEHREIARMWSLIAIDKCNHSDTFKMVTRMKGEGVKDITVSAELATNILNKMKTIPKAKSNKPPSVLDALRFTVKLEENLNSVHFSRVVKFVSEQDTALMASSLKSSSSILHMMTEEYVNLAIMESDTF